MGQEGGYNTSKKGGKEGGIMMQTMHDKSKAMGLRMGKGHCRSPGSTSG